MRGTTAPPPEDIASERRDSSRIQEGDKRYPSAVPSSRTAKDTHSVSKLLGRMLSCCASCKRDFLSTTAVVCIRFFLRRTLAFIIMLLDMKPQVPSADATDHVRAAGGLCTRPQGNAQAGPRHLWIDPRLRVFLSLFLHLYCSIPHALKLHPKQKRAAHCCTEAFCIPSKSKYSSELNSSKSYQSSI